MVTESDSLRKSVEQALAFAHAALEEPTAYRISQAKSQAAKVLPLFSDIKRSALTLGEAGCLFALAGQLRAVLQVLEGASSQLAS